MKLFRLTVCTGLLVSARLIRSVLYLRDSHKVNSDTQTLRQEGPKNKSDEVFLYLLNLEVRNPKKLHYNKLTTVHITK